MYTIVQEKLICESNIIPSLETILKEATPALQKQRNEIPKTVKDSLDTLFPEQRYEEKNLQKAKDILGVVANELTADQLKGVITEIQYLVDSWLDDYERNVFDGLTLKELLHEKRTI